MQRLSLALVPAFLVLACGADPALDGGAVSSAKETRSGGGRALSELSSEGLATFYDANGGGNCSFAKSPDDLDVVALAFPDYAESAACGACLEVTGPKGKVTVRVTDSCPGCEAKGVSLDLSESAFAKIAAPKDGRVEVTFQQVSCSVAGNLAYHFKDGSSKWWTAIQIRNHRVPIAKVEYRSGGSWVEMKRSDYNYFIASDGVGDQKSWLELRVTATDGQKIEETLSGTIPDDETVGGTKQFR